MTPHSFVDDGEDYNIHPHLNCTVSEDKDKALKTFPVCHADAIFVDDGDDYIIHPHLTCTVTEDKDKSLKNFSHVPGLSVNLLVQTWWTGQPPHLPLGPVTLSNQQFTAK